MEIKEFVKNGISIACLSFLVVTQSSADYMLCEDKQANPQYSVGQKCLIGPGSIDACNDLKELYKLGTDQSLACYAEPFSNNFYCGATIEDANTDRSKPCPTGTSEECPPEESCFDLTVYP